MSFTIRYIIECCRYLNYGKDNEHIRNAGCHHIPFIFEYYPHLIIN